MNTFARTVSRFGTAWLVLCLCLALHVGDEAVTGFLDVYNPVVRGMRSRLPFLPLPTFTFEVWLALLVGAIVLLLALGVFAFRGARWTVWLAYPFGVLMLCNGLAHLAGSVYMSRAMPGVYSGPLLLAASLFLLVTAGQMRAVLAGFPEGGR